MSAGVFEKLCGELGQHGEAAACAVAAVAEAIGTVFDLARRGSGAETVAGRSGDYKRWDPEVFRVDAECEDVYIRHLEDLGRPVVMLSEEAERVEINMDAPGEELYASCDPFDGSFHFKRGIEALWYTALGLFDARFEPLGCAVGQILGRKIAFAGDKGAFLGGVEDGLLGNLVRLDHNYRARMGRPDVTDVAQATIASYAMKPERFLFPLVDGFRALIEPFKFFFPNGGPYSFAHVAAGSVDVYLGVRQPHVDVFSGLQIALEAELVVTDLGGGEVRCVEEVKSEHDILVTTNPSLHEKVLGLIASCRGRAPDG